MTQIAPGPTRGRKQGFHVTESRRKKSENMPSLKTAWEKLNRLVSGMDEESRVARRLDRACPVLIYQMGKVGSSSLKKSLVPIWPGPTIHSHNIAKDQASRPDVRVVYDRIIRKRAPIYIISPVREPIGRTASAFFQNFEKNTGVKYRDSKLSIEELTRCFLRHCTHSGPVTWFENYFAPIFDMDVYQYDFPASGVRVIQHHNVNLLLMRCEIPDAAKESAVRTFLNLPGFSLRNTNVGSEKDYAQTYKQFTENFVPPDWYLAKMYNSRFFEHFYGTEKDFWIEKWTGKSGNGRG